MNRIGAISLSGAAFAAALAFTLGSSTARSQEAAKSAPRTLAPGVETTIPIRWDEKETVAVHDAVDLLKGIDSLAWDPKTLAKTRTIAEMSKNVRFRTDVVWNLQLTFKPVRMIRVDVPKPDGKMERRLVWYMIYRVQNLGQHMSPELADDGTHTVKRVDEPEKPIYFQPKFTLECPELEPPKAYADELIPVAVEAIVEREKMTEKPLNTIEISENPIPLSSAGAEKSAWGVVTWAGIDPTTDFFSIYVRGLTNAYRWVDKPEEVQPGDVPAKGREFTERYLKLNFWRPGDEFYQNEKEIRYGRPDDVDYEWVWR